MAKRDLNEIFSRIAIPTYGVIAVINLAVFFLAPSGDLNNISIVMLMGALIANQKGVDAWREAAQAWQQAAEKWRDLAE